MSKPKSNIFTILSILFVAFSINVNAQEHLKHEKWTSLLNQYVDSEGHVNYKGIKADEDKLDEYLAVLSANHPEESWDRNDRLAYWINAYNAFTVKLIVKNYPVKSIKDLGGNVYKVNTSWDIKFIKIGEETYDLNNIEHDIIRKEFDEGRIHFAVNCASVSCPPLRNEAYLGSRIDEQLDDQVRVFLSDTTKNIVKKDCAKVSKIFNWFKGDITSGGLSIVEFINKYSDTKLNKKAKISYQDYDWNLNE